MPDARQQYYANKVRELGADDKVLAMIARSKAVFNNLERLSFYTNNWMAWKDPVIPLEGWAANLLIERLECLELCDARYLEQEALLEAVAMRCRRLKSLTIDGRHANLKTIVKSQQDLKNFTLRRYPYYDPDTEDPELFSWLIACSGIESIDIGRVSAREITPVEQEFGEKRPLFAKLKEFETHSDVSTIPRLIPMLNSSTLKTLKLTIEYDPEIPPAETAAIVHLVGLTNLTLLDVSYDNAVTLLLADMQALGSFTKLRELEIGSTGGYKDNETGLSMPSLAAPDLTDNVLADISENWQGLTSLRIYARHNLTSASLITLGRRCRRLQSLEITGIFDVRPLDSETEVLFPQITTLIFSRAVWGEHAATDTEPIDYGHMIIDTLFRHTPKLATPWPDYRRISVQDGAFGKRLEYYGKHGVDRGPVQDDGDDESDD